MGIIKALYINEGDLCRSDEYREKAIKYSKGFLLCRHIKLKAKLNWIIARYFPNIFKFILKILIA